MCSVCIADNIRSTKHIQDPNPMSGFRLKYRIISSIEPFIHDTGLLSERLQILLSVFKLNLALKIVII